LAGLVFIVDDQSFHSFQTSHDVGRVREALGVKGAGVSNHYVVRDFVCHCCRSIEYSPNQALRSPEV
jgi:hypothetical protein